MTIEAIEPILDLQDCLAKTYIDSEGGQIRPGRTVSDHCCIVGEIAKHLIKLYSHGVQERYFPTGSSLLAAAHDVGKISPIFQKKIYKAISQTVPKILEQVQEQRVSHQEAGYATLCAERVSRKNANVVAKHHGFMPSCEVNLKSEILGGKPWHQCRVDQLEILKEHFQEQWPALSEEIQTEVLTGLTTLADWIGSGYLFDNPKNDWKNLISTSVESAGFVKPVIKQGLSFKDIFGMSPYPIQETFCSLCSSPGIYLLEAPMGLGKTEAALYAAYRMLEQGQASGVYFALPTQLTSNKIYERFNVFLSKILDDTSPTFRPFLIHGNAHLSEYEMGKDAVPGGTWFSSLKRAILAPFGVGTIDQSLIAAIPDIRHSYMRSFGLLNKVVILDEVHSYDMYTGTILDHMLKKLSELNCTVIILSATVTKARRAQLLNGIGNSDAYPLISLTTNNRVIEQTVAPLPNNTVALTHCRNIDAAYDEAIARAVEGQQILWIENTVASAQEAFARLNTRIQSTETTIECGLLHSHFIKIDRDNIEKKWVPYFGKNSLQRNTCGRILVGTQILEQSLDIDADFLITRLCPMDMFLQRLGRLWRHQNPTRATTAQRETWVILPSTDTQNLDSRYNDGHDKSGMVYSPYVLARTEEILQKEDSVILPGGIRRLIEATYEERQEIGQMKQAKKELEKKAEVLKQKANMTASKEGKRYQDKNEDNPGTRYSEIETVKTFLLRDYRIEDNGDVTVWFLNEGNGVVFPKNIHRKDRNKWRSLAIKIDNNCLNIAINKAPQPFKNEALSAWLCNFVYLGINNSQFRLARVSDSDLLIDCDFNVVSDKYNLNYNSIKGYISKQSINKETL